MSNSPIMGCVIMIFIAGCVSPVVLSALVDANKSTLEEELSKWCINSRDVISKAISKNEHRSELEQFFSGTLGDNTMNHGKIGESLIPLSAFKDEELLDVCVADIDMYSSCQAKLRDIMIRFGISPHSVTIETPDCPVTKRLSQLDKFCQINY